MQQRDATHLEHLQILQSLLHQLLYPPWVLDILVLAERVPRAALGVLAEVVGGELVPLAEELPVLYVARVLSAKRKPTGTIRICGTLLREADDCMHGTPRSCVVDAEGKSRQRREKGTERHTSDSTFCADSGLVAA